MIIRLMVSILLLAAGWQQVEPAGQKGPGAKTPYVDKSEKQFAFSPGGKLEISAAAPGNFRIVGWPNPSLRVEIEEVFFYLSPDEAQAVAKRFPVYVTNTPTSARIRTSGPPHPGATLEVNVIVYVPGETTDLNVKMIKGDLSIASLRGSVEATIEEGNLEIKDVAGYFSAVTKRGDLSVALAGPRWNGYGFWGKTSQGSIDLMLPADYSAALQLGTRNGKISVDYPALLVQGESVPLEVMGKNKASSVRTPIGSGGAPINLQTLSGNIAFKKK